ncbi:MAG: hypothetical protein HKN26_05415 [Acidimicrobiales bacterium]|nr:hypothetical protein [Acidimicrobiales bacterium]
MQLLRPWANSSWTPEKPPPPLRLSAYERLPLALYIGLTLSALFLPALQYTMVMGAALLALYLFGAPTSHVGLNTLLWPVGIIVLLGTLGIFAEDHQTNFIIRDYWLYVRLAMILTLGFNFGARLRPVIFLRWTVRMAIAVSGYHIYQVIASGSSFTGSARAFRSQVGRGHTLPVVALAVVFTCYRYSRLRDLRLRSHEIIIAVWLSVASVVLSFSRVRIAALLLITVAPLLVATLQARPVFRRRISVLRVFALLALVLGAGGYALFSTNVGSDFSDKVGRSFSELTSDEFADRAEINERWRSWERQRAWDTYEGAPPLTFMYGFGFGQLIDSEVGFEFDGEILRFLPVIHDGFTLTYVKVGVFGLAALFWVHYVLWRAGRVVARRLDDFESVIGSIGMWSVVALILITPAVNGVLNYLMDPLTIFAAASVAMAYRSGQTVVVDPKIGQTVAARR